jgi:hypothetical protein
MWGSFSCPQCHKLLRVRRNFTIRILRLVLITGGMFYFLGGVSAWLRQHLHFSLFITAGTIGVADEYVMRLFPATIESALPGGFIASQ